MKVLKFPLARIAVWFILGLLAVFYLNPDPKLSLIFLELSLLLFGIIYYFSKKNLLQKNYFGIATYGIFFLIGITTQSIHNQRFDESHYIHKIESNHNVIGITLIEKLKSSKSNNRYFGKITSIDTSKAKGKILLNIRKDSLQQDLMIGSKLLVNAKIYKHHEPSNPNQFDYGKYLENKSVYGQIYTDASAIKIYSQIDKSIWYYASSFRNTIIKNLEASDFRKEELNVVVALILGQQQDISSGILKDYQLAGAVHILSVSGLHVGCIMIFIGFLLKPLPHTKLGSFIRLFIILAFLWIFALIAGFSPSVTRSVVMFSFVAVGKYANRKTNIFHTLIVSMLFILLFEPSFIFDVGFQLSYCALFFIVWLQPLLSSVWQPENWLMKYFWDILTVSFAAQIGAFPLSIYYFHQFPGLFFLTNLLVLPLLGFILGLGVVVMLLAVMNIVPHFLVKALEWSIYFLNRIINWVASFESFVFENISFNWQMLLSCYLLIFTFIIYFKKPNFAKMALALGTIVLFQLCFFGTEYSHKKQEELIVFNVKRSTIISERKGEDIIVYSHDSLPKSTLDFAVKPYVVGNFSSISKVKNLNNVNYFNGNKILIVDSLSVFPEGSNPDIVIMTQSPKINLDRILEKSKPKMIVADASNYTTYTARWKATCDKKRIPFHSTVEKGFYKLSK